MCSAKKGRTVTVPGFSIWAWGGGGDKWGVSVIFGRADMGENLTHTKKVLTSWQNKLTSKKEGGGFSGGGGGENAPPCHWKQFILTINHDNM